MQVTTCRSCGEGDLAVFLDLGKTPLADALVRTEDLDGPEERFPLPVAFCDNCKLVQITEEVPAQKLFVDNYLYFSSFSDQVAAHSRAHAHGLIASQELGDESLVVELASNDGYLLKFFVEQGIPVLGIDPAPDQAAAAVEAGVPTLMEFFGVELAERLVGEGKRADVIIANNVTAHVPELGSFIAGMKTLLADDGVITIENPTVQDLISECAFDTIYHEHFCYYSCLSIDNLMRRHGLFLNDVEYFPGLHGGTLRWHMNHHEAPTPRLLDRMALERSAGLDQFAYYADFGERVARNKDELLSLLTGLRADGKTIAGYGAAAKGATLVNYVGIGTDLVEFVVDRNVHKHGLHMPGTHQPILDPAALVERQPDYVLLLAWNFAEEIAAQQQAYLDAGGQFIVPVPTPRILS